MCLSVIELTDTQTYFRFTCSSNLYGLENRETNYSAHSELLCTSQISEILMKISKQTVIYVNSAM